MAAKLLYSDEKVAELLEEYHRTGNYRLRDAVVEHMRPLVHSVARKFAGREPLEDLESEGYVGLIRAVDRFSSTRGARFSTFATYLVAGHIRHYLRDRGHLIRQPAWLQELSTRVQRISAELEQRLHRAPTAAELAEAANVSEEGIEELLAARQVALIVRMDGASDAGDDEFLVVDEEKFRSREYATLQLPIEDRIVLENALGKLKELERKVLYAFFFQDRNQSEIARTLGISCNYTGYVLRKGLKHMREGLPESSAFEPLVEDLAGEDSVLDGLTGLYNRRYFERRLGEEVSRAHRAGDCVSVGLFTIANDPTNGPLLRVSAALRERTRKADILARTGPDELGVVFPSTGAVAARVVQRLADQVSADVGRRVEGYSATFPQDGRSAAELLSHAQEPALQATLPAVLSAPLGASR